MKIRALVLSEEPICRVCRSSGKIDKDSISKFVDHIVPLSQGGKDERSNWQGICKAHHDEKTALESYAAANHPAWLKRSAIPLTIVSGPPCSGKTTYITENARQHDTVIDLDGIMTELRPGYKHWAGQLDQGLFNHAVRLRNTRLGALASATSGRAWFIVSAPSQGEREWWHAKLGGTLTLLHPGISESKRRAIIRGTPRAVAGIDAWDKASRAPWIAPGERKTRQAIGTDGWPE